MKWLCSLLLVLSTAAGAETCLVVGISDGDTLKVRCGAAGAFEQVTIRLAEVDAPEKGQPFGARARAALAAQCFGAAASIAKQTKDRYGRLVARVECRGEDASAAQVRAGMAWWYERYSKDRSLRTMEQQARAGRMGLWADSEPTPPWEWRRERRTR